MASSADSVLELVDVSKRYGAVEAVREVSLRIARGEFLCVIGPSGCGKTTLLRMIAGFLRPSGGDILLEGRSVVDLPPFRRPVNTVFQHYALFPHMTVAQNIAFGLEMQRVPAVERERRTREALAMVELDGYGPRSVRQLSGGEQQRVALARALVNNPTVLLLDEPLGALDQKVRRRMQLELKRIHRDVGITFVHVTHDQEEAMAMADRVAVMNAGRIEQVDTTHRVYARPATPFVAEFIGESNRFDGHLRGRTGPGWVVQVHSGVTVAIPDAVGLHTGRSVRFYVRPEQIRLGPPLDGSLTNAFEGRVEEIVFLGDVARYYVSLAGGLRIMASAVGDTDKSERARVGDAVLVGWRSDVAVVFPEGAAAS